MTQGNLPAATSTLHPPRDPICPPRLPIPNAWCTIQLLMLVRGPHRSKGCVWKPRKDLWGDGHVIYGTHEAANRVTMAGKKLNDTIVKKDFDIAG